MDTASRAGDSGHSQQGRRAVEGGSEGRKQLSRFPLWTHIAVGNMVHCYCQKGACVSPLSKQDTLLQVLSAPVSPTSS